VSLAPPPSPRAAENDRILQRLQQLHPRAIDLSLDRLARLLQALGDPHRRLPPVVHVAGTNGKGSTIAYMRAALEAGGYRVHVYTSPHLVRFNERIRLAGQIIDDDRLAAVLEACEAANAGQPITHFEITTAAAFLAFVQAPADILLLEVGLGGEFDATNLVDRPLLSAITTVSMDHQRFLGDDLASIAHAKAGILKPGVPAAIGRQAPAAMQVIARTAAARGAPLHRQDAEWSVAAGADGGLTYRSAAGEWRLPPPVLPGRHQYDNAGLALACLELCTGFPLRREHRAAGLRQAEWPARLQRLTAGPLAEALPEGAELWLDGGHNPGAGEVVAATLADWRAGEAVPRPLHVIFAMMESKDADGFLGPFRPLAPQVYAVPFPAGHAALSAEQAAAAATRAGLAARVMPGPAAACAEIARAARRQPGPPPRVLICGSLYLVGEILKENR
jgi:dihydrofolate synthase/folylpolyglutamate synthase